MCSVISEMKVSKILSLIKFEFRNVQCGSNETLVQVYKLQFMVKFYIYVDRVGGGVRVGSGRLSLYSFNQAKGLL